MNANIHLDRGTRVRLAADYIVADTPDEAESIHQSIIQGITTPNYDQYGGATVSLATDGAQTEYIAFCAKQLSSSVFGFYIINLATLQPVPYSPFCTGRGSISNAGKWVAWKDKDYFKGLIPGFVGYPDQSARITALEARVAALEARAPVPGPQGPAGPQGPQGVPGPQGPASADGSGGGDDELRALLRTWLGIA